jgi:Leucine-rich repeat (LRR) protein
VELGNLTALTVLSLRSNQLTSVPAELGWAVHVDPRLTPWFAVLGFGAGNYATRICFQVLLPVSTCAATAWTAHHTECVVPPREPADERAGRVWGINCAEGVIRIVNQRDEAVLRSWRAECPELRALWAGA